MSKYFTSRYVVRANKLWSTYRNSPLKYHFRAVCEMASTRIVDDLRAKFGKSTSVNFLCSRCAISRFSSAGGVNGPQIRCASHVATATSAHEINVATTRSRGQCIPSSRRLPMTPVAQTNKIAMVNVRRRGHSKTNGQQCPTGSKHRVTGRKGKPVSFCQCERKYCGIFFLFSQLFFHQISAFCSL